MSMNVYVQRADELELARLVRDRSDPSDLGQPSVGRGGFSMSRIERWERKLQEEIPASISAASTPQRNSVAAVPGPVTQARGASAAPQRR